MNIDILLAVWGLSLFLAVSAVTVLARPLRTLLVDICGTEGRANFWTLYASVLLVLAPLLVVSAPGLLDAAARSGDFGPALQRALFYALVGIIGALVIMGYGVWRPVLTMAAEGRSKDHDAQKRPNGEAQVASRDGEA